MQIAPGTRIGPYEIVASIGAGGMGEVWRAHDPRIGRDVAIKFVPAALSSPDRLHRFEQEARTAGSLNHPNLVTVFDFGTEGATPYVVMELLDGETLRVKLDEGRIPIRKSVDYATQIASGLAAAHEHGIVHRDLKPENIIVTSDGRVKIVDFGLAKLSARSESSDIVTQQRDTTPGTVLGTAGYMSPEQVRGQQVDHRSDIFSFGAIFYEMLSGRRAFRGESSIETMNAVLKEEPPELASSDAHIPPALGTVVHHCLEKNANERFQSARDLAFDLQRVSTTSGTAPALAMRARRNWMAPATVALAIAAAAVAGWTIGHRGAKPGAATTAAESRAFEQLTFRSAESQPSLAPDGKTFVYVSRNDIYLQRVDGRNAINLTKDTGARNYEPAFSPDGAQIAFRSDRNGGGIFIMGATGESVRRLTDFGFNPAWSPDGTQLSIATNSIENSPQGRGGRSTLWIVDVRSGAKRQVLKSDAVQPSWSPHGNRIAYWALIGNGGQRDIFTVDPHAADPEKSIERITADPPLDWTPVWSPDGKWLYFGSDRDGTLNLWRVPMDETTGKKTGPLQAVTLPSRFAGHFSISRSGDMVFDSLEATDTFWRATLPPGEPRVLLSGSMTIYSGDIAPDGQWIVFSNLGPQEDIYIMRIDGTDLRQLTNDPERDRGPTFSNDGSLIYFYSQRGGRYEMWSIHPDGSDLRQVSNTTGESHWYPRMMPDGKALYAFNGSGTAMMPFNADGTITRVEPLPTVPGGGVLLQPKLSADGKRFAGDVRQPLSQQGIWTHTIATKQYERLTDRGTQPEWISNDAILFVDQAKAFTVDARTKAVRPFAVTGVRSFDRIIVSRDMRTLLIDERAEHSVVWLMKGH